MELNMYKTQVNHELGDDVIGVPNLANGTIVCVYKTPTYRLSSILKLVVDNTLCNFSDNEKCCFLNLGNCLALGVDFNGSVDFDDRFVYIDEIKHNPHTNISI